MKSCKRVFAGLLVAVMVLSTLLGQPLSTKAAFAEVKVGADDNSTAYLGARSGNYEVKVGKSTVIEFTNYVNVANKGWDNYGLVLSDGATTSEEIYTVVRADNWANEGTKFGPGNPARSWFNWDKFMDHHNGAKMTAVISRSVEGIVYCTIYGIATDNTKIYEFLYFNLANDKDLYASLTVGLSHLTVTDVYEVEGLYVGTPKNDSAWFASTSPCYTLNDGANLSFKFINHTNGAENFNTFNAIFSNVYTGGTGYKEYGIVRADHFVSGDFSTLGANLTSNYDWGTFKTMMEGAEVTITASRSGTRVNYRADIKGSNGVDHFENFFFDLPNAADPCVLWFTGDGSHMIFKEKLTSMSVNSKTVSLLVGKTSTIQATAVPNATLIGATYTYSSDKTSIATVDTDGKITAVAAGTATITVTCTANGVSKTDTVTVNVANEIIEATGVAATVGKTALLTGEKVIVKVAKTPSNATNVTACELVLSDGSVLNSTPTTNTDNDGKLWFEVTATAPGTCTATPKLTVVDEEGNEKAEKIAGIALSFTVTDPICESDLEVDEKAPNITINTDIKPEDIFDLTDDEKALIYAGATVGLKADISNITDTVPTEVKAKVQNAIKEAFGEEASKKELIILNIDVFKKIGENTTPLSELKQAVEFSVQIPDEWILEDNENREYYIVRLHDGEAEIITGTFNPETKEFTFETDKFSTYALAYVDNVEEEESESESESESSSDNEDESTDDNEEGPRTGDTSNAMIFMLALAAAMGAVVVLKVKKTIEE